MKPIISQAAIEMAKNGLPVDLKAWLFDAIISMSEGVDPTPSCPTEFRWGWEAIRAQQQSLIDSYNRTCEKRRIAGSAGGYARAKSQAHPKQMLANASKCQQMLANAGKEKENEKESEKEKDINTNNESENARAKISPSISAVKISRYEDIFDPAHPFSSVAISVTGELNSALARNSYAKFAREKGEKACRNALATFWGQLQAGEFASARSLAAILTSKYLMPLPVSQA